MSKLLGQKLMPTRKVTVDGSQTAFSLRYFFSLLKIFIIITHKTKSDLFLICICDLIKTAFFFCTSKFNYKVKKITLKNNFFISRNHDTEIYSGIFKL